MTAKKPAAKKAKEPDPTPEVQPNPIEVDLPPEAILQVLYQRAAQHPQVAELVKSIRWEATAHVLAKRVAELEGSDG